MRHLHFPPKSALLPTFSCPHQLISLYFVHHQPGERETGVFLWLTNHTFLCEYHLSGAYKQPSWKWIWWCFFKCCSKACRTSTKHIFFRLSSFPCRLLWVSLRLPKYLWQSLQYAKWESSPNRTWTSWISSKCLIISRFDPPKCWWQSSQNVIVFRRSH